MVMDCKRIIELIPEYSVGLVEGKAKTEMDDHLAKCPSCAAEVDKLNQVMAFVDDLGQAEPPDNLWHGVYKQISSQKKRTIWDILKIPIPVKPLRWSLGISMAAIIIVILFSRMQAPDIRSVAGNHVSNEFTQGHIIYTNTDLFADPASINSTAALIYRDNEGVRVQ